MKKIFLFICLALSSLACLTTVPTNETPVAASTLTGATMSTMAPAAAVMAEKPAAAEEPSEMCAVITAEISLHLRKDASEHSQSLAFMAGGEVVQLINQGNSDWWLIKRGELTGYGRERYLKETECE